MNLIDSLLVGWEQRGAPAQLIDAFLTASVSEKAFFVQRDAQASSRKKKKSERQLQNQNANINPLLNRHHVHADVQGVLRAAKQNSMYGTDVAVIAAPGHGDVTILGYAIVRRIEIDPTGAGAPR
jgi:hypothetical protein